MSENLIELNKCPNCSGKMKPSSNRSRMVCPFCGSEFAMDSLTKESIEKEPVLKEWFIYEWDLKKLTDNPKVRPSVDSFVRTLNDYDSAEEAEGYIRKYLLNYDEVSAPGLREEKMSGIMTRIAPLMEAGERVILYDDDGLFIHGKTGVVITDRRTFFIEKKTVTDVMHSSIPYLFFEYSVGLPAVKLGNKYGNNIGIFNSHFELQGAAAALICFYSFESDGSRPKIRLTS